MLENIDLKKIFTKALSRGGEMAELYAESTSTTAISHENHRIEKVNKGLDAGYGLRLLCGNSAIYGFTNMAGSLIELAETISKAAGMKEAPSSVSLSKDRETGPKELILKASDDKKVQLVERAAGIAWGAGTEIKQVQVNWRDTIKEVCIANSRGLFAQDTRKDTILVVLAVAEKNGFTQTGYEPAGGMVDIDFFDPETIARDAVRRAVTMLKAKHAPRGLMPVVISSEAGGTMIHEAVGHGLEADLACQGMSVYKEKLGLQVASSLVTIVDDATLPLQRGSFKVDDEGFPAQRNILINGGKLVSYMHDAISARKNNVRPTGNGRRESYRNRPVVRMTNTILCPGRDDPASIVRSVEKGLFIRKMGGGQVNTINGDFVFEAQEAYLIEKGKVGDPVRGATIIGNGPKVLLDIDMVGTDLGFGLGTCGKEGQGVPVGHGMPTIRIPQITVGGTG